MFEYFKKRKPEPREINLAEINSREKAVALLGAGVLQKLFLMPPEFGGEDSPLNTTYAPDKIR